mmetsp:Transcript_15346/g.21877  ORF Transcript_15346/g.21877 Transcript_15346/m.21877 type:complete len:119 (-) Transcript_15346:106-462(-)
MPIQSEQVERHKKLRKRQRLKLMQVLEVLGLYLRLVTTCGPNTVREKDNPWTTTFPKIKESRQMNQVLLISFHALENLAKVVALSSKNSSLWRKCFGEQFIDCLLGMVGRSHLCMFDF